LKILLRAITVFIFDIDNKFFKNYIYINLYYKEKWILPSINEIKNKWIEIFKKNNKLLAFLWEKKLEEIKEWNIYTVINNNALFYYYYNWVESALDEINNLIEIINIYKSEEKITEWKKKKIMEINKKIMDPLFPYWPYQYKREEMKAKLINDSLLLNKNPKKILLKSNSLSDAYFYKKDEMK